MHGDHLQQINKLNRWVDSGANDAGKIHFLVKKDMILTANFTIFSFSIAGFFLIGVIGLLLESYLKAKRKMKKIKPDYHSNQESES